jgi:hypothetical protein
MSYYLMEYFSEKSNYALVSSDDITFCYVRYEVINETNIAFDI